MPHLNAFCRFGLIVVGVAVLGGWPARTLAEGVSRPYLVRAHSSYRDACLPPCRCNLDWRDELRGGFELTRVQGDGRIRTFEASDARLVAPALERTYTGAGIYQISGPSPTDVRLRLDLQYGDFAAGFDSGVQAATSPVGTWPVIDLAMSFNGLECHDTIFGLVASPAADWNADGWTSIEDVFVFLDGYFAGDGDADGDGGTDIADLFAFLADFFHAS